MKLADIADPRLLTVVKDADGHKWVQPCYVCGESVNFRKTKWPHYVQVGPLVRHAKCDPEPLT